MNPLAPLLRLVRTIKHLPERRKHASRRARAVAALSHSPAPVSVLFLCQGNLCRSPYAAGAAVHKLRFAGRPIQFHSAGFSGPADRPTPPDGVSAARQRGVDLSGHRSQLVNHALLDGASWIFVMSPEQRAAVISQRPSARRRVFILGDLDPEPIKTREIIDPINQRRSVFTQSYERIDRCLGELAQAAWRP